MRERDDQLTTACPSAEELVKWVEGGCGPESDVIQPHLDVCAECTSAVGALAERVPTPIVTGPLANRYHLDRVLDHGGLGVVCTAHDSLLRRRVAVKLIRRSKQGAEALIEEAVAQAAFSHPNVVSVLDAGVDAEHAFIVLELVEGVDAFTASLAEGFTVEDVRRIACDAAQGLAALHRGGLTHGDVTPRNIVVGEDDHARLIDFGLAGHDVRARGGTPGFQPPETERGAATPQTDQFGLGKTILDLLSRAEGAAPDLSRAARRASDPDPSQRYPSISEFLDDLTRPVRRRRGRRLLFWIVAILALISSHGRTVDGSAARLDDLEEAAHWALVNGELDRAERLSREAEEVAARAGSAELELRAALISARVAGVVEPERAHELRVRAARIAERVGDAELRAEALARLAAGIEGDDETADLLLELAGGAAEATREGSAGRRFLDKVEVLRRAVDPETPLPPAEGELAPFVDIAHAYRAIGAADAGPADEAGPAAGAGAEPEPGEEAAVSCAKLEGEWPQGLCLTIHAASAGVGTPASLRLANDALAKLEPVLGEDHCDLQLGLFLRGSALLDRDDESAERALARAKSLCPDDPPEELFPVRLQWARAALRLGRIDRARAVAAEIDPSAADSDTRELYDVLDRELSARDPE